MPSPRLLGILVCVLSFAPSALAGETISDPQLGFRFTVPDGFVPMPEQVRGDVIHAFHRPDPTGRSVGTLILIQRMHGVLGRERLDPQKLVAKNPTVTVSQDT